MVVMVRGLRLPKILLRLSGHVNEANRSPVLVRASAKPEATITKNATVAKGRRRLCGADSRCASKPLMCRFTFMPHYKSQKPERQRERTS